jgi:hypothetical protein
MNGRPDMAAVERRDAIEALTRAVQGMGPDDLLDFHNELFPKEPESALDPKGGVAAVRKKVTDYLGRGLEIEEILDLWNVAFPEARNVYYDDETDTIYYNNEREPIRQAE